MKKINILTLSVMALNMSLGACEFTITNDSDYNKIYISMNSNLADIVSEKTLKNSSFSEKSDDGKMVTKQDFSIAKDGKSRTPFTKWFDVFVPLKANGQFERRYRIKMHYCSEDNAMTLSQIKNKKINMKRFEVINFHDENQAQEADAHCIVHAPTYEHQSEYKAKLEKGLQLKEATPKEINAPMYPLENYLGGKEVLP